MKRSFSVLLALAFVVFAAFWALRQGGLRRGPRPQAIPDSALSQAAVRRAKAAYDKDVQPIFKQACFDCHTTQTVYPWYHQVPGVRQWLEDHVDEGKHHMDMTDGFPFKSRMPLVVQLRAISQTVKSGVMPMWQYRLMHPLARLSPGQKKTIEDWASTAFDDLSRTARPYSITVQQPRNPEAHPGHDHDD